MVVVADMLLKTQTTWSIGKGMCMLGKIMNVAVYQQPDKREVKAWKSAFVLLDILSQSRANIIQCKILTWNSHRHNAKTVRSTECMEIIVLLAWKRRHTRSKVLYIWCFEIENGNICFLKLRPYPPKNQEIPEKHRRHRRVSVRLQCQWNDKNFSPRLIICSIATSLGTKVLTGFSRSLPIVARRRIGRSLSTLASATYLSLVLRVFATLATSVSLISKRGPRVSTAVYNERKTHCFSEVEKETGKRRKKLAASISWANELCFSFCCSCCCVATVFFYQQLDKREATSWYIKGVFPQNSLCLFR